MYIWSLANCLICRATAQRANQPLPYLTIIVEDIEYQHRLSIRKLKKHCYSNVFSFDYAPILHFNIDSTASTHWVSYHRYCHTFNWGEGVGSSEICDWWFGLEFLFEFCRLFDFSAKNLQKSVKNSLWKMVSYIYGGSRIFLEDHGVGRDEFFQRFKHVWLSLSLCLSFRWFFRCFVVLHLQEAAKTKEETLQICRSFC